MGWFGKDRFGTVQSTDGGRVFRWILPNWSSEFKPGAYDSPHGTSFAGAEFHFHLVIANEGDLGVYIHYKSIPIPKYSFHFSCNTGTRSRQHTALNIPPDTERVGHWNVCKKAELVNMLSQSASENKDTLMLVLSFDDDKITRVATNESDVKYSWKIPRFAQRYLEPFTSTIFLVDGLNYVVRIDKKRGTSEEAYSVFLFSRRSVFPPHTISLVSNGNKVAATEERNDMTTQILNLPGEVIKSAIGGNDASVQIDLEFRKGGNPLDDAFNAPSATSSAPKTNRPETVPGCEGSSNPYSTVITEDEV